jgi:hypothetical protein
MMFRIVVRIWRALPSILAGVVIITIIWLFVVFPRVVNQLAGLLGNMGDPLIPREQLLHTLVALVASLIPLYWLIIRPFRQVKLPQDGRGLVVRQGQGLAYIDSESVRHQVYRAVSEVGGVKRTEVSVENEGGRAVILLNLTTENSINGGRKKQEIRREIKKVVEDQLGVQLAGEPTINFRLAQLEPDIPQARPEPKAEPVATGRPASPAVTPARPAPPASTRNPVNTPMAPPPHAAPREEKPEPAANPVIARRAFTPTDRTAVNTPTTLVPTHDPVSPVSEHEEGAAAEGMPSAGATTPATPPTEPQ